MMSLDPSRTVMKAVVRTSALLTRNRWRTFASTSARRIDASGPARVRCYHCCGDGEPNIAAKVEGGVALH
jgi:hypothetical protein